MGGGVASGFVKSWMLIASRAVVAAYDVWGYRLVVWVEMAVIAEKKSASVPT